MDNVASSLQRMSATLALAHVLSRVKPLRWLATRITDYHLAQWSNDTLAAEWIAAGHRAIGVGLDHPWAVIAARLGLEIGRRGLSRNAVFFAWLARAMAAEAEPSASLPCEPGSPPPFASPVEIRIPHPVNEGRSNVPTYH